MSAYRTRSSQFHSRNAVWTAEQSVDDLPETKCSVSSLAYDVQRPHYGLEPKKLRRFTKEVLATISFMDAQTGRLLDALGGLHLPE